MCVCVPVWIIPIEHLELHMLLQELIDDGAIGDVVHIQHLEPVRNGPGLYTFFI